MSAERDEPGEPQPRRDSPRRFLFLSLAALGVVYGDIGTSPLYAIRECFHGQYGIESNPANVLGVLSLIFWALLLVVTIKYLGFILLADNRGEGGVIALTALLGRSRGLTAPGRWFFIGLGLFGASLLYGDGMITPAISVMSAVEGIRIITPALQPYVIPATVVILALLFLVQHRGTERVGALFGPVTLLWFGAIAILGVKGVVGRPEVLRAINPIHGCTFLLQNRAHGFLVLGAVVLVVTGAEALYADMGHFGRRPIRFAWLVLVMPALLCNYFGQGAVLLVRPEEAHHPFYALAPAWALVPLVILATAATIIASQAVISGAYSLTRQAVQLGYLPRLRIIHTSAKEMGQIYVPQITWVLAVATIGLVVGFQKSSRLAAAYGVAVTMTMLTTTILFYLVARNLWRWNRLAAGALLSVFLVVDGSFFVANIGKITHGAWFPLAIGAVAFALLTTWKRGRSILREKVYTRTPTIQEFLDMVAAHQPMRVPGKAVFMAGTPERTPPALLHNLKHNRILHSQIAILTILTEDDPTVPRDDKVIVENLAESFHRVIARYGFMEDPSVPHVLALAREKGLDFALEEVSFFVGRERLLRSRRPSLSPWRAKLFAFMSRNAVDATAFFHIPPGQVIELGTRVEI